MSCLTNLRFNFARLTARSAQRRLIGQQRLLSQCAVTIIPKLSDLAYQPMTRNQHGDGVMPNSSADGSGGGRLPNSFCQTFVRGHCASRNREQCLPNLQLEVCASQVDIQRFSTVI